MNFKITLFLALSVVVVTSCNMSESVKEADKVFYNGNIYTVSDTERVEAVATLDGRIVYSGGKAGMEKHVGESTMKIDLDEIGRASCRERV